MKHFYLIIFSTVFALQLNAQNKITFKTIGNLELGVDKDDIKGVLTEKIDSTVQQEGDKKEITAKEKFKIKTYDYKTDKGGPFYIAGVPFENVSLDFAYNSTLSGITLVTVLNKDSAFYNIDSSKVFKERLKKFINTELQIKFEETKEKLTEPFPAEIISVSWKKDERNYDSKTHLHDRGNLYNMNLFTASMYTDGKNLNSILIQITLTNDKYYLMEYVNGKLREK